MAIEREDALRGVGGALELLIRAVVREEVRAHLGPGVDELINVKKAPMSARKLRQLVKAKELRGFKHGRDTFISTSEFRAWMEGRATSPRTLATAPPPPDSQQAAVDAACLALDVRPADPRERAEFEVRVAALRAMGGAHAATVRQAEEERTRAELALRERGRRHRKRGRRGGRPVEGGSP